MSRSYRKFPRNTSSSFIEGWQKRPKVKQCVVQEMQSAEYGGVVFPQHKGWFGWRDHAYYGEPLKEIRQGHFTEMDYILNDFNGHLIKYREQYLTAVERIKQARFAVVHRAFYFGWINGMPEIRRLIKQWEGDPPALPPLIPYRFIERAARKKFNRPKRRQREKVYVSSNG